MRRLTDPSRLLRSRARVRPDALFLHAEAAAHLEERLEEVNRTFTAPALVAGIVEPFAHLATTRVADGEVLDLAPGAHDLVIHAMALHWADDPVGQIIQCRRALRPDGLFLGVLLGGQTLSQLRAVLAEAEAAVTGGLSPRVAPMADIRDLGGLLQRAGLALPVADSVTIDVAYRDIPHLAADLRAMGEGNALADRGRPLTRSILRRAEDLYRRHHPRDDGRIGATFELIFLSGWAPDPSQQQPLRPGSAAQRLADALGTPEIGASDPADPRRR